MFVEQTLVIVKPDGMAKRLVGEILHNLTSNGMSVISSARTRLPRQLVERLYAGEEQQVYFKDVVDWVSSATVLLLKVEGVQAVGRIKWEIIGRYPKGMRGKYSQNWIKNVAHVPDSSHSAERELDLMEHVFKEATTMNQERFKNKMVFALTGMSECGKSTVGQYLDSKGIRRLKIVRLFERAKERMAPGSSENFRDFVARNEAEDPYAIWDVFIDELHREMDALGTNMASIESLYGGGLGPYLKQRLAERFCIVYVDIPAEVRLQRQMIREGLSDIEAAKAILYPRDEIKEKSGIPTLKEIAGEVIDNSGALDDLYRAVDEMIERYR
jgi:nucleoside-diphosphate kinase